MESSRRRQHVTQFALSRLSISESRRNTPCRQVIDAVDAPRVSSFSHIHEFAKCGEGTCPSLYPNAVILKGCPKPHPSSRITEERGRVVRLFVCLLDFEPVDFELFSSPVQILSHRAPQFFAAPRKKSESTCFKWHTTAGKYLRNLLKVDSFWVTSVQKEGFNKNDRIPIGERQ